MTTERLELPDGQWAEISTARLHKTVVRVQNALMRTVRTMGTEDVFDSDAEIILAMVTNWHVLSSENGQALPLDVTGIGNAPESVIAAIYDRCMEVHSGKSADSLPPASAAPSGD